MSIKVSDIKAKEPCAEVYEIKPECRYLVLIKGAPLEGLPDGERETVYEDERALGQAIAQLIGERRCLSLFVDNPADIRILEVEKE